MKYRNSLLLTTALLAIASFTAGCLTSRTTTVTPGTVNADGTTNAAVTNTVVTVNEANLAIDCSILTTTTSLAVSLAAQDDPKVVPALKQAQIALDGVLNGANPNTTTQILNALGGKLNPTAAGNITGIVSSASSLEQNLLKKYGASVAGEITLAIARAIDDGLTQGLAGIN
jgi:hypothetical protein